MAVTLATILDQSSNLAVVEKILLKKFLIRQDYDTVMANSKYAIRFKIDEGTGQYVEATKKDVFRMPQNLSNSNPTSDPASGANMTVVKKKFPLEFIQEYIDISTIANWTSWIDLVNWAEEDLPLALRRRRHQMTQAALKVGRFQPGVWSSTSTVATTAFDTTAETTPTIYGISWSFDKATQYFVSGKTAFASLTGTDRHTMADYLTIATRMTNSGAPKINGRYIAFISDAVKMDLMEDDSYFKTAIHAWNGKGIAENQIADYRGIAWVIDDEPYKEALGTETVRSSTGQVHTSFIIGKNAFAYLDLGGRSGVAPKFKVQDISLTGVNKTIGYLVPWQCAVVEPTWCASLAGPVSVYETNE